MSPLIARHMEAVPSPRAEARPTIQYNSVNVALIKGTILNFMPTYSDRQSQFSNPQQVVSSSHCTLAMSYYRLHSTGHVRTTIQFLAVNAA